jgi:hypothetical protein
MTRKELKKLRDKAIGYQCTYSPGVMKVPVRPGELRWVCEELLRLTKPKLIKRRKK